MIRRRKPINRPEQALQRACVGLLERFYEPMPDVFWTAINPVPAKSKAVAGISKAMGLKPGVPDMVFILKLHSVMPGFPGVHHSKVMFVEFKADGGKLSDNQHKAIDAIKHTNACVHVVTSVEQFVQTLENHSILPKRKFTLRQSADEYLTDHL